MAEMMDESRLDCEAMHWAVAADRIAFERHFGTNTSVLAGINNVVDDEGQIRQGADLSGLREEWLAFFAWRELRRHHPDMGDYGWFTDNLEGLTVEGSPDAGTNPTVQEAQAS